MNIGSETSDNYGAVIAVLDKRCRVIEASDESQWILQVRKKGREKWPWRASGYFLTRDALIKRCINHCYGQLDPATERSLNALPPFYSHTKR